MRLSTLPLVFALTCAAQTAQHPAPTTDNAELKQMFIADQFDRGNDPYDPKAKVPYIPGNDVTKNDAARRTRVRQMIDSGLVRTGADYFRAALVFQHGSQPQDYLLAHVLAEVSVARGGNYSRWLSAAALDRYLLSIGQSQIFGTQFDNKQAKKNYDPHLLNDSLRAASCVPDESTPASPTAGAEPIPCE
jgi:hypothetical protein